MKVWCCLWPSEILLVFVIAITNGRTRGFFHSNWGLLLLLVHSAVTVLGPVWVRAFNYTLVWNFIIKVGLESRALNFLSSSTECIFLPSPELLGAFLSCTSIWVSSEFPVISFYLQLCPSGSLTFEIHLAHQLWMLFHLLSFRGAVLCHLQLSGGSPLGQVFALFLLLLQKTLSIDTNWV